MEQLQKNQSRLDYLWDNFGGRKVVDKLPDAKLLWYDYTDSNQKETYSSSIYGETIPPYNGIKDMAITSKYMYLTYPEFPEIFRLDKYNGEIIDNFEEESAELLGVIDDKLIICTNNSALYPSNTIKIQTGDDFQFETLIDESDTSDIECLSSFNGRAMAVEGTLENGKILILSTYVDLTQVIRSVLVSYKLKDGKYIGYDIYTLSDSTIEPNYKVSLDILEDNKIKIWNNIYELSGNSYQLIDKIDNPIYTIVKETGEKIELIRDSKPHVKFYGKNIPKEGILVGESTYNYTMTSEIVKNTLYLWIWIENSGFMCITVDLGDYNVPSVSSILNLKENIDNTSSELNNTIDKINSIENFIYPKQQEELTAYENANSYGLTWQSNSLDPYFTKTGDRMFLDVILDKIYAYDVKTGQALNGSDWTKTYSGPKVTITADYGNAVFYLSYEGGEVKTIPSHGVGYPGGYEYCLPPSLSVGQTVHLCKFEGDYFIDDMPSKLSGTYSATIEKQVSIILPNNTMIKYYPLSVTGTNLHNFYSGGSCTAGITEETLDLSDMEVAIKIPEFYYKFKEYKDTKSFQVSTVWNVKDLPGWKTFESVGVSAYPCVLDNEKYRSKSGKSSRDFYYGMYYINKDYIQDNTHLMTLEEYNLIFQWLPLLDLGNSFNEFKQCTSPNTDSVTGKNNDLGTVTNLQASNVKWRGFEFIFKINHKLNTLIQVNDITNDNNRFNQINILDDNKNIIASSPFLDRSATNIEDIDFQYSLPIKVNKLEGTGINNKIIYGNNIGRGKDGVCSWDLDSSIGCIRIIYSKL